MNKLEKAVYEINLLREQAEGSSLLNERPSLFKLLLTIWYILLTVSFDKYDIFGLLSMGIYPLILFLLYDIPFRQCCRRIKVILPFLLAAGVVNPFWDRSIIGTLGNINISGGMMSMVTLILKGFFTILSAYLLMVSTSIEKICGALRRLHVPTVMVTIFLLIYRYLFLLLQEAGKMVQAYSLRAPGQKGIQIKAWGSLLGLLLLRSMDRAENIYESMGLRGLGADGGIHAFEYAEERKIAFREYIWFLGWASGMLLLRIVPLFTMIGQVLV